MTRMALALMGGGMAAPVMVHKTGSARGGAGWLAYVPFVAFEKTKEARR